MPLPSQHQPLSALQAAMLGYSRVADSGENVEQVEIEFAAGVSMEKVESAWEVTVARTAALRMAFRFNENETAVLVPTTVDAFLSHESQIPGSWETWLAEDRKRSLLANDQHPWRAALWAEARKLIWTFHHALLDGNSIAKILRTFQSQLISDANTGELGPAYSEPPTAEEITVAAEFHRHAFSRLEECQPEFPADASGAPAQVNQALGAEIVARLDAVARRLEVPPATILTWAWGQTVATAAGAEAVAIGQVRSGPPRPGQAGFTMNTVPLVVERDREKNPATGLQTFCQHLLDIRAIENVSPQELPVGMFQETGGPWPGGVVMIQRGTLHHEISATDSIRAITLHETSSEPLLASAWIQPELRMEVEVNGSLYGIHAAQSLLDHWASIVTAIAEGTEDPCALPAAMRESLSQLENGGKESTHAHLAIAWRDAVKKFPANPALLTGEETLTYAELGARVEHLAARLHEAGVKAGQPVASLLRHRKHLALVLLAVSRVGAINVPLDPALPANRLDSILEDAGPVLVIGDQGEDSAMFPQPFLLLDEGAERTCASSLPDEPRATLSILYTSGSTGRPKGVMMVHCGVTNEALGIAGQLGIGLGDRVLQFASPGFDASLEEVLATLLSGATLVPRPESLAADLNEFQNFIRQESINILDLSTAHWAAWCAWLAAENLTVPESVRATIIGGERAAAAAVKDWFASGGGSRVLLNTYGPTEASVVATVEPIEGDWKEPGDPAIGRPLPGVLARVADATGRALPYGAAGELWLGGVAVGEGYWKHPDLTAIFFREIDGQRWYRTGDRVWRDEAGKLRFLGRQDDQLKIRGNRVEPNEVIRVLEGFAGVSSAHAGPFQGRDGSPLLAAWVRWEKPATDGWPGLLAAHAALHLPAAAIPTRWAAVESFKLTERGKLDRRSLPEPSLTASIHTSSGPPATPTEERLAAIWSELLGVSPIGRDESFFELGGHSLAALQLFARIAREWNVRIPMAVLIQSPTPRLLGRLIDQEVSPGSEGVALIRSILIPVKPDGHLPPLFCIHGGDGGVFFYNELGQHLPADRPMFAIESPTLATQEKITPAPVGETAATYAAEIRRHQPTGPYFLAGYSYGGLLVYEIARLFIGQGETIAFAGLFDTVNPATRIREYSLFERMDVFWNDNGESGLIGRITRMISRAKEGIATHLRFKREIRQVESAGITPPHSELRMLQVREAHWKSMMEFEPQPLDCHVTLFKSDTTNDKFDIPKDYGWTPMVSSLEIIEVPGRHLTMFSGLHVAALANQVQRCLRQEERSNDK
jgi:amino acid adenylation domain-containing protein